MNHPNKRKVAMAMIDIRTRNLVTEEHASKMWCVELRNGNVNPLNPMSSGHMCAGGSCMGWRWVVIKEHEDGSRIKRGYCGVAGISLKLEES